MEIENPTAQGHRTPPHHPIFGVHVDKGSIRHVIEIVFSDYEIRSIHELPSGESYNNRIYFIDLRQTQPYEIELNLVLKVNGRFFGADKIQNEVGGLLLLEATCPSIPAPRIRAWSEDGRLAWVPHGGRPGTLEKHIVNAGKTPGWILMTRVPGERLEQLHGTLGEADLRLVGTQVAEIVAGWRRGITPQRYCGNLRFSETLKSDDTVDLAGKGACPDLAIRGVLGDDIKTSQPIDSVLSYYKIGLEHRLCELQSQDVYAPNRAITPMVEAFINETLPHLALVRSSSDAEPFVFTHYDLSPRNVLVTGSPPVVSGVVDFEFSGFFPTLDEFVNDYVDNGGDWPAAAYKAYLDRLRELGVSTPASGVDERTWNQAVSLGKLKDNVAPWWLPGPYKGEELLAKLRQAEEVVGDMISKLKATMSLEASMSDVFAVPTKTSLN